MLQTENFWIEWQNRKKKKMRTEAARVIREAILDARRTAEKVDAGVTRDAKVDRGNRRYRAGSWKELTYHEAWMRTFDKIPLPES